MTVVINCTSCGCQTLFGSLVAQCLEHLPDGLADGVRRDRMLGQAIGVGPTHTDEPSES